MVNIPKSALTGMTIYAVVALLSFLLIFVQKRIARAGEQTKFGRFMENSLLTIGILTTWMLALRLLFIMDGKALSDGLLPSQIAVFGVNVDTLALIVSCIVLVLGIVFIVTRIVFVPWLNSKAPTEQNILVMIAQFIFLAGERRQKRRAERKLEKMQEMQVQSEAPPKEVRERKQSKFFNKKTLTRLAIIAVVWYLAGRLLELIFGKYQSEGLKVEIFPPRVHQWGLDLSTTTVTMWTVMAVLIVLGLIIRFILIPRFKPIPKGAQNVMETMIDSIKNYTDSKAPHMSDNLAAYILTIAALLVGCAMVELVGVRAPTADIMLTFSLALCTFFLINFYGIKEKHLLGRIKSLAQPTPLVFPIKVLTEMAIPVSMACRLFGNMLAGMIVMELLYTSLGSHAIGVIPFAGLYFNVFHPLIQAFIFVTLTLTFINEAVE